MNGGKLLALLVLACGFLSAQSAQPPEPILKSAGQPTYPPLARAAHIEGEVRLEFVLNRDGDPSSVTVISGHPMLVPATIATVKTWKFEFPENAFEEGRKYETTFAYKLAKKERMVGPRSTNSLRGPSVPVRDDCDARMGLPPILKISTGRHPFVVTSDLALHDSVAR